MQWRSENMLIVRSLKFFFLLMLAIQPAFAQVDSLVDVFPLVEGNQWLYSYGSFDQYHNDPPWVFSGTVELSVIGRIATSDSVRWQMFQRRKLDRWSYGVPYPGINDSTFFELVEKLEGRHQLICSVGFPFFTTYTLGFGLPDTCRLYRFASVDSSGAFTTSLYSRIGSGAYDKFTYVFKKGIGVESVHRDGLYLLETFTSDLDLLKAAFTGSGAPLCVPSFRRLACGAVLGDTTARVIVVSNPSAWPLHVIASVSNPHVELFLDQGFVPANSSTQLHVRFLYTTALHDTVRIILSSNAASSPDTITLEINAGNGVHISFDPKYLYISNNVEGVLGNPVNYPVSVSNNGPVTLVLDSVVSDSRNFTPLRRLKTLSAGAVAQDSIEFKPLQIGQLYGNILYYSNSVSSPDTVLVGIFALGAVPQFSPRTFQFTSAAPGTVQQYVISLINAGNFVMTSGRLVSTNPAFSVAPQTVQLGVGASTTVQVSYTVSNADSESGLILAYNHPVPPETLFVFAAGTLTPLRFSTHALDMGKVAVFGSQEATLTVTNAGRVTEYGVTARTTDPHFVVVGNLDTLESHVAHPLTVRFSPKQAGPSSAWLIVELSGQVPVDSVALSGTGTPGLPEAFVLEQNYPNPFNLHTTIRFSLASTSYMTLKVFDVLGQVVATIAEEDLDPGTYERQFDGSNLASGVYYYRIQAGNFVQTRKLLLLR